MANEIQDKEHFDIIDNPNDPKRVQFILGRTRYVATLRGEVFEDPGKYEYPTNSRTYELQRMIADENAEQSEPIEQIRAYILMKKLSA